MRNCGKEYIPYTKSVNVKEHRAPTDKSVELLDEFNDKLKDRLLKGIKIVSNRVELSGVHLRGELWEGSSTYHFRFILNGQEYTHRVKVDRWDFKTEPGLTEQQTVIKKVFEGLSKQIAVKLVDNYEVFDLTKR